jgi:hypothetical protein
LFWNTARTGTDGSVSSQNVKARVVKETVLRWGKKLPGLSGDAVRW